MSQCASVCAMMDQCCSATMDDNIKSCYSDCCPSEDYYGGAQVIRKIMPKATSLLRDCGDIPHSSISGIYRIYPLNWKETCVYCDMETDGGGWTVFQRRKDGAVNFFRSWTDYKKGFGDLSSEHWLGNDNIHFIASQGSYKIRIDFVSIDGITKHALYNGFVIGNELTQYKLFITGYNANTSDLADSMTYHNEMKFSTWDVDNDPQSYNCALDLKKGGWWYKGCANFNINGLYSTILSPGNLSLTYWYDWRGYEPMRKTVMMIRKN